MVDEGLSPVREAFGGDFYSAILQGHRAVAPWFIGANFLGDENYESFVDPFKIRGAAVEPVQQTEKVIFNQIPVGFKEGRA